MALSNITVVGGTLTNTLFNIGRRHPFHPGPLIDWELILVMEPSTILGAVAGGFLNHVSCLLMPALALGPILYGQLVPVVVLVLAPEVVLALLFLSLPRSDG